MVATEHVTADTLAPTRQIPCLVVLEGQEMGKVIPLEIGENVMGRGRDASIRLDDKGVSRRHAMIRREPGRVILRDLGSTNGLWCNGKSVSYRKLKDGDRLQLGRCLLAFRVNRSDEQKLLRHLYERATRDALTGLYNRPSLMDRLAREVARHERYGRDLSVIVLDLDHFKTVNDTHGHAAGDILLRHIGKSICKCLRSSDIAARVGGEEFVVALPETDQARARKIAEKIRTKISSLDIKHDKSRISITASLGVATADKGPISMDLLLKRADEACYKAKRSGRNRIRIHGLTKQQRPKQAPGSKIAR